MAVEVRFRRIAYLFSALSVISTAVSVLDYHFDRAIVFLIPPFFSWTWVSPGYFNNYHKVILKYINYFSQNQKGFGCIVAAVLLILSSKELI